ncbi:MAG: hypothetical protein K0V04_29920 [Deltaproteobacteria bacterium]|nr:hypothetical protein [Deltaproteobacteria bacterium]
METLDSRALEPWAGPSSTPERGLDALLGYDSEWSAPGEEPTSVRGSRDGSGIALALARLLCTAAEHRAIVRQ